MDSQNDSNDWDNKNYGSVMTSKIIRTYGYTGHTKSEAIYDSIQYFRDEENVILQMNHLEQ